MSLGGILLALNVSRPKSYLYVFTDATASDHKKVTKVLDMIQRKQSQVVFVLTGHCNDLHKPSYKVYQQIASASSGQVFNLNKTNVHMVLDFVRSSIKGRTVNLASAVRPAGYNYTQGIKVDKMIGEVTVSVSGARPQIEVVDPSGVRLTGPPKLVKTLDLSEIMIVKVLDPEPGNWSITVGSEQDYSVKVVGLSNLTFSHGFSVLTPGSMAETSYRPLQGTYNNMMISLSDADIPVKIDFAEILNLEGKTIFEVPLKEVDGKKKIYLTHAFVPPDDFFYIAINGHDERGQEFRRIASIAVQPKTPDAPYIMTPQKVQARNHERVVLTCGVESLVPITAMWTKDKVPVQDPVNSLQSSTLDYVIEDMGESHVGTYHCIAKNVAGRSESATAVELIVDPPEVTIAPVNKTLAIDESLTISCSVYSETSLIKPRIIFSSIERQNLTQFKLQPSANGFYNFNKTILHVSETDGGKYSCIAANRGGQTIQSTYITIQTHPIVQILGPHALTKPIHTDAQFVCHVEHADTVTWLGPDDVTLQESKVNGTRNDILDVKNVTRDGTWTCVASRNSYRATDSLQLTVLMKPRVKLEGDKNITILNGTVHQVSCIVVAKPAPRILWHRETEAFLNHTVTVLEENTYKSVLTLDSTKEQVNGTYFCFGENSEGIDQDSVTVDVRRKMVLLEGFTDQSVELYSQLELHCRVDAYPPAITTWLHNGTTLHIDGNTEVAEDTTMCVLKVDFHNLGLYTCIADNGYERLEVNGTISVHGLESPLVSKEPIKKKAKKGESAILTCRVIKGNPEPTVNWEFKSDLAKNFSKLPRNVVIHDDRYEIEVGNVDVDHAGTYRCVAKNAIGQDVYDVALVVHFPPQLSSKESHLEGPIVVEAGDKRVFSCRANGLPPPIVTWTKFDMPVSFSNNVHLTDNNELVFESVSEYDSGVYTCKVSNALGAEKRNFTVVVYSLPEIASPGIEPEVHVLEGQLVELPCIAAGTPAPSVTWLQNSKPHVSNKKYFDEYGLRFVANLTDFGNFTCIASNQYGNTSLQYNVFVWVPPRISKPMQVKRNVVIGSNLTLSCDAVGFPIPVIMWEFQGELLKENSSTIQFNQVGNLFIQNASLEHAGVYACVAENSVGVDKKYTLLRIDEPPTILGDNYTGSYVATNLDSVLVIPCTARGTPRPYVVWSKDDQFLDSDFRYHIDMDGTLTIKNPSEDLSGEYTCIAMNTAGSVNKTVTVEIYSFFTMQGDESQSSVTVVEGKPTSVECPVHPNTDRTVKWYKDAVLISNGTLTFPNVSRHNASTYACVVSNAVASAYASVNVIVQWAPSFLENVLEDVEVVKGDDWYFDCKVDAKPRAKVKWYLNSKLLLGEDREVLKLLNVQVRHTGTYKCVASNEHGAAVRQFTVDVLVPPTISDFDLLDVQLKEGSNATLDCDPKGSPAPEVKWTFNNTCWSQTNSSLVSSRLRAPCGGLYRCDATNTAGTTHIVYRVDIVCPATVRDVLVFNGGKGEAVGDRLEVTLGTKIRIACQADGNPIPTIQWTKHGNTISVNDKGIGYADLVIKSVDTSDAGVYTCIASNEGGLDERKVKIEVLEPPRISQALFQKVNSSDNVVNIEVISGSPFYLHCHPHGNPLPEVYWFKDDSPLRFYDDSMVTTDYGETVVTRNAKYEQSGNYTCVARNKVGNTSVIYLVDVLVAPPQLKDSVRQVLGRSGLQLNLTCPALGQPPPYVTWVKHPYLEISEHTPRVVLLNDNYTLIINETEASDSGKYSCIITNKVGTTEVVFEVTVEKAPSIAGNVGNETLERHVVPLLRSVVLKCEVDGHPTPKITWLKDIQQLSSSSSGVQLVLGGRVLALWAARPRDAAQYICVAESAAGTAHRRYDLVVRVPGKWSTWSQWGYCNVTCGLGYQTRSRFCHYIDDDNNTIDKSTQSDKIILDESACKGPANDRRKCHMPPCEEEGVSLGWGPWSRWGGCSATCGAGTQARTRRCRPGARCNGDNVQVRYSSRIMRETFIWVKLRWEFFNYYVQIRKCPNLPKCPGHSDNTEKNEILYNRENRQVIENPYLPEVAFEMQPEVVESHHSTLDDDFYLEPEVAPQQTFYDVNVTENIDHSEQGPCNPGYRHNPIDDSCEDIDECSARSNVCHATQLCGNTPGGYRCGCARGYVALAPGTRCLDVNECSQGVSRCAVACVNVAGGYVCACPQHLRLHADRHHCVAPSLYQKPISSVTSENLNEDFLSTSLEHPARYAKMTRH
ncbi:hemicentin-1-like [Epargyreus clarus]|uniref:hemicentin-1-like n=1 Tax=Epargyreus clarus TaxID=520877 RepID=UPI003C30C542